MKLDFEQLNRMKENLHKLFLEDGNTSQQLGKGSMVYSVSFDPGCNTARVHVQWPYFCNLVANEADRPATYSVIKQPSDETVWMHWTCFVQGIEISACMNRSDIIQTMQESQVNFHWTDEDNVEDLFKLWQHFTGWNMSQYEEVYI